MNVNEPRAIHEVILYMSTLDIQNVFVCHGITDLFEAGSVGSTFFNDVPLTDLF